MPSKGTRLSTLVKLGVVGLLVVLVALGATLVPAQPSAGDAPLSLSTDVQIDDPFVASVVDYAETNAKSIDVEDWESWKEDRINASVPSTAFDKLAEWISTQEPYSKWSFDEWDKNIQYRGLDFKPQEDLESFLSQYYVKIFMAVESLGGDLEGVEVADVSSDISRLCDKFISAYKELEFRAEGLVERKIHHTTYYIDLDSGSDSNDGLSTGNAWLTIEQYTTTTSRSPGDIAWVRANTSETVGANDINCDEDGTVGSRIEIRGCSSESGEDPWGDSSDVKPIIDFNNGAYSFQINTDFYWRLYNLEVKNSSDSYLLYFRSDGSIVDSCKIHLNSNFNGRCLYVSGSGGLIFTDCVFLDAEAVCAYIASESSASFTDCTFDSGSVEPAYDGLWASGAIVYLQNCEFGENTSFSSNDLSITNAAFIFCTNCKFNSFPGSGITAFGGAIYSQDHNQVAGASASCYYSGVVNRSSSIQLDGLDSVEMAPDSDISSSYPLTISNNNISGDYQLWCPASETTVTIKARETSAWTSDPSSSEFYFVASYLDESATSAHRATVTSTQSLSGTSEISFTMTFTPAQAGWVYIWCYLEVYEVGESINVSVKPTVS